MNIFYFDSNPTICAQAHMDRHLVKMPWEYVEILQHKGGKFSDWAYSSAEHYNYLVDLILSISKEFHFRYGQAHPIIRFYKFKKAVSKGEFTPPPMHVPKMARRDDIILSYREYYNLYLWHMATWSFRPVPEWFRPESQELFYLGDERPKLLNLPPNYDMYEWERNYD